MKIGDVVYNEWHGIRRYGIVEHLAQKDEGLSVPWTYAKVRWFNDNAYEGAIKSTNKLRNNDTDIGLYEYRCDKIRQINLEREISTLLKIRHFKETEL